MNSFWVITIIVSLLAINGLAITGGFFIFIGILNFLFDLGIAYDLKNWFVFVCIAFALTKKK